MPIEKTLRRNRFAAELRITVWGTDWQGQNFAEETYTTFVARHGAKIVLARGLFPLQEITIRCDGTGRDGEARVLGLIGENENGRCYAVQFLDPEVNVWGVEFPPLAESEADVERVLLECLRCKVRALTYLDELEAEVFEANQVIWRNCKNCKTATMWRRSAETEPTVQPDSPLSPPPSVARTQNERRYARVELELKACVRSPLLGEEVVSTENVSRGGFQFKSWRAYAEGMMVQVSLPYMPGGVNVYTPARIARVKNLPPENVKVIGVAYISLDKNKPDK